MKWFKHFSDNHRGQSVQFLLDELGYFGPFFKDTIFEMCMEKLDKERDQSLTEDDCVFVFHMRVITSATRSRPATVRRALDCGATSNFWKWSEDENQIKIRAPILLDLLDYDSKRTRPRRVNVRRGPRLESEPESEPQQQPVVAAVPAAKSSQHPGFAMEARFAMEPHRKDFEEAMGSFIATTGLRSWNKARRIDQALRAFDSAELFWQFLDDLAGNLKKTKPPSPMGYCETAWKNGVLERIGDANIPGVE